MRHEHCRESARALNQRFQAISNQFELPAGFSPQVVSEAERIIQGGSAGLPDFSSDRRDATEIPLVTLDPASSTDLDQAFAIEQDGDDLVLRYALADVSAFVSPNSEIETEAWKRGLTIYGLAKKIPLYPKEISQGAASLLPDGPRPAVLVSIALSPSGKVRLRDIDRVICRSRAKLAYDAVDLSQLPFVEEFASRMWADEVARGAIRVEFPQQEVIVDESAPGGVRLVLRPRVLSESINSTLSLSVNMAVGTLMQDAQLGLFRVMDDPATRNIEALRRTAHALGIAWSPSESLRDLQRRMDPQNFSHQRFLLDARRAGGRARYAVYRSEKPAWHCAIGANLCPRNCTHAPTCRPLRLGFGILDRKRASDTAVVERADRQATGSHGPMRGPSRQRGKGGN